MSSGSQANDIAILEPGWSKFPTFFVDELMPISGGIPASFWKYILVVWRDVCGRRPGFRSSKTMTQFQVSRDTAMKWTAALSVSCLFDVKYGVRHKPNEPGIPTEITYRIHSTQEDWRCFIAALRDALIEDKRNHYDDVEGFRILVALTLANERQGNGLPVKELDEFLAAQLASGVLKKSDEGGYEWERVHTDRTRVGNRVSPEEAWGI